MKNKTQKQIKRITALAITSLFFVSGCATTQYVPKQNGVIKIMPKGYQKDDQLYKRGLVKQGLVKAVEPNAEATRYAKKSSKNAKWAFGLLWGGLASTIAGVYTTNPNEKTSSTRNTVGYSLYGVGLASILTSIFPALQSKASETDAINKYNDDVLLKWESK